MPPLRGQGGELRVGAVPLEPQGGLIGGHGLGHLRVLPGGGGVDGHRGGVGGRRPAELVDGGGHLIALIVPHPHIAVPAGGVLLGLAHLGQPHIHRVAPLVVGVAPGDEPGDPPGRSCHRLLYLRVGAGHGGQGVEHLGLYLVGTVALVQDQAVALGQGALLGLAQLEGHGVEHRHHKLHLAQPLVVGLAGVEGLAGDLGDDLAAGPEVGGVTVGGVVDDGWDHVGQVHQTVLVLQPAGDLPALGLGLLLVGEVVGGHRHLPPVPLLPEHRERRPGGHQGQGPVGKGGGLLLFHRLGLRRGLRLSGRSPSGTGWVRLSGRSFRGGLLAGRGLCLGRLPRLGGGSLRLSGACPLLGLRRLRLPRRRRGFPAAGRVGGRSGLLCRSGALTGRGRRGTGSPLRLGLGGGLRLCTGPLLL